MLTSKKKIKYNNPFSFSAKLGNIISLITRIYISLNKSLNVSITLELRYIFFKLILILTTFVVRNSYV